jgi:hypothetical protein
VFKLVVVEEEYHNYARCCHCNVQEIFFINFIVGFIIQSNKRIKHFYETDWAIYIQFNNAGILIKAGNEYDLEMRGGILSMSAFRNQTPGGK